MRRCFLHALLIALVLAGPVTAQDAAEVVRASLVNDLLDPWYPRALDDAYGGYLSNFAHDWEPDETQDKFIVTQARHVWTTARAAEFFADSSDGRRQAYLDMAAHGVAFLRDHMWDEEHGGFRSLAARDGQALEGEDSFSQGKTAYGNAFGIYGLAAYADVSGDEEALEFARRAFGWFDDHAHDPEHGGYFQFFERDGTPLTEGWRGRPPKDQNSSIHILEALTELYRVWPDPLLRDRLEEMLVLVRDTMVADPGYLHLFFHADWTPVSFRDSSESVIRENLGLDHVSFGHDVETAYLMLEAAHALGIDPAPTLAIGKRMVDHALAYGWDEDVGGLFDGAYYFDAEPEIVMDSKAWWAQAEAMNTFLLMSHLFPGDPQRYGDRFHTMWSYIQSYLIDHDHGGWYVQGLDRDPEARTARKGTIWKGAYHDGRALMNVIRGLEGVHD